MDASLCGALKDVLAGEFEPNIGTVAASIALTITALRTASDHEERLAKLEAQSGETAIA